MIGTYLRGIPAFDLSKIVFFFRATLAGAISIQHLGLEVDGAYHGSTGFHKFQFKATIPSELTNDSSWPCLRTLELMKAEAYGNDLVALLSHIRPTVKSILFRDVQILRHSTYRSLLDGLRDNVGFTANEPKFIIEISVQLQD